MLLANLHISQRQNLIPVQVPPLVSIKRSPFYVIEKINREKRTIAEGVPLAPGELEVNYLAPNDVYISRTAQLISSRCILNIYTTDILTEYFKHAACFPFFFLSSRCRLFHNAIFLGSYNIHILNTECVKILKKIPAPKS